MERTLSGKVLGTANSLHKNDRSGTKTEAVVLVSESSTARSPLRKPSELSIRIYTLNLPSSLFKLSILFLFFMVNSETSDTALLI